MLLAASSTAIGARFSEVNNFLSYIKAQENIPPTPDSSDVKILRGLFYIHLYGAFEYSIKTILDETCHIIEISGATQKDLIDSIGAITLDGAYNAIASASPKTQWDKRIAIINKRKSQEVPTNLANAINIQNIWVKTIESIYAVFGNTASPLKDISKAGYIREAVETRNEIAHGNASPESFGALKRADDLRVVFEAIQEQTNHVLDTFESYLTNKDYLL